MLTTWLKHRLQDEVGADGADGGGGEGGNGDQGGGSSAISQGTDTTPLADRIPEKYRVFSGEGEEKALNFEETLAKTTDGYNALAKRLGNAGDAPPEDVDGYEIDGKEINEDFNFDEWKKDEVNSSFLKSAHAKGFNNYQIQWLLGEAYNNIFPAMSEGNAILSVDDCVQLLKTDVWKTDQEFTQNMAAANRVYKSLPQDLQTEINKSGLGNNPLFNRIAAIFGAEMSEDTPPGDTGGDGESEAAEIAKIQASEEYHNPNHPDHARLSKRVQAYYARKYPGKSVA